MTNEQQPAGQPPPNWCRTCGKHRDAADAVFCSDAIHLKPKPADQGRGVGDAQLCAMTKVLQEAWAKAEPNHDVTLYPASYVASFVDMARAAIAALTQSKGGVKSIIAETIGFNFEEGELQPVNADDLLRLAAALSLPRQSEAVNLDRLVRVGDLPAPLTHSQAWPQGYVDGWNDYARHVDQTRSSPQPAQADTTPAAHGVGLEALPPAGSVLVPIEPTEAQWSGLARDVVMWMNAYEKHTSETLLKHLHRCGTPIPEWLKKEADTGAYALPKGSIAAIIYKAMLQAASAPGGPTHEESK